MSIKKRFVKDWMTVEPVTITSDTSVSRAEELMEEFSIRHLPVVDDGELIGMISLGDIRAASASDASALSKYEQNYLLAGQNIESLMARELSTIDKSATISEAATIMLNNKISSLPVLLDGKLEGIITSTDIFRIVIKTYE